ncbi:hypothetical protein KR038_012146, partial [Drosophila bunnanda]
EHNYSVAQTEAPPSQRNLRQLICNIHATVCPTDTEELSNAEVSRLLRHGQVIQRRLRRLLNSRCRFIEFEPMMPLQEAIAQELAKQLGFYTNSYNGSNDTQYMVAYRPGVKPNALEVRARRMCRKDRVAEIVTVEEYKLYGNRNWHQPTELVDYRPHESVSLGRTILEEFNRDYQPNRKKLNQNRHP